MIPYIQIVFNIFYLIALNYLHKLTEEKKNYLIIECLLVYWVILFVSAPFALTPIEIWSLYHFMKCGIALNVKMKIVSGITHMEVKKIEDSMIILIITMNKKKSLLKGF